MTDTPYTLQFLSAFRDEPPVLQWLGKQRPTRRVRRGQRYPQCLRQRVDVSISRELTTFPLCTSGPVTTSENELAGCPDDTYYRLFS